MVGTIYVIPRGGLGNILFNYMIGYSLSKKYGLKLVFTKNTNVNRRPMSRYVMFKNCKYIALDNNIRRLSQLIKEATYFYTPVVIKNNNKNHVLDGYFQSFKYSSKYVNDIKTLLLDTHPSYPLLQRQYTDLKNEKTTILFHVRRGDYLKLPHHYPIQSDEYYQQAIRHIVSKVSGDYIILVFSDDTSFVQNWKLLKLYPHKIVDKSDPEECFMLMTMCDHFIIANSTFSLLAYHFRDHVDSLLCAPKRWFGPKGPKYKMEDLIELTETVRLFE